MGLEKKSCAFSCAWHISNQDITYRDLFNFVKELIILVYFFHALEVVIYSVVQYVYVFSTLFNRFQQTYVTQRLSDAVVDGTEMNLLFLNYFMITYYIITSL